MGLAWQQGPLGAGAIGRFLTAQPMPEHLLFAEPLRRRMRVRVGDDWIADSENVLALHEPGRYPVAYFPMDDVSAGVLVVEDRITGHGELGDIQWYTVVVGERRLSHAAWQHTALPAYATELTHRVAFAWRAMDGFYEEDDRIVNATLEVVILPVSDVDKSLDFYRDRLRFTFDVDYAPTSDFRVVQLTPPGSSTSIQFGVGLTDAHPGSVQGLYLVVDDVVAVRNDLVDHGVGVTSIRHKQVESGQWRGRFNLGVDPHRSDYASFADFSDPDGNSRVLQERGHRHA